MREALSGTSSQCFTVSPALISIFGGCGLVGVGCVSGEATIGGPRFGRLLDSQNGSRKVKHFEGFCKKLFLNVIEK